MNSDKRKKFDTGKFDFIGKAKYLIPVTLLITVFGIVEILVDGFNYGIDFAGGTEIQIQFDREVSADDVRTLVNNLGYERSTVQSLGDENEFLIRLDSIVGETEEETNELLNQMTRSITEGVSETFSDAGADIRRVDSVGPQVGSELKRNGILATFYSLLIILIYIGLRFDYKYAPGAVFCLAHDVIIVLSVFAVFGKEVNIQTMAAILTLIGYSLNDTIITFDRIRENERVFRGENFAGIVNRSINDMLVRTIITSVTTGLALGCLYIMTEGVIKDIAFTLILGIVVGVYSSIFIAAPMVIGLDNIEERRAEARRKMGYKKS